MGPADGIVSISTGGLGDNFDGLLGAGDGLYRFCGISPGQSFL